MRRNAFGQLVRGPHIRSFFPDDGANGAGGGGGAGNDGGKEFEAITSQEEFDRRISNRVTRAEKKARDEEAAKYSGYDDLKSKAEKYDAAEAKKDEPKTPDEKTQRDLTALREELEKERTERQKDRAALLNERTNAALTKALEGRTLKPSALTADRSGFVRDGNVDADAIKDWVEANSAETPAEKKPLPGQGQRGGDATGIDAGKTAYERRHPQKKTT